jgi:hypothetical protein
MRENDLFGPYYNAGPFMPILIRTNGLSNMVSADEFSNEEELELLLADFPDLLRADGGPGIVLVDRQVYLEAGKLDLLFITREGLPIAVEVKLARNGESRRQVVAQAIDYLSSLTSLTVDELDALVNGKLKNLRDCWPALHPAWRLEIDGRLRQAIQYALFPLENSATV